MSLPIYFAPLEGVTDAAFRRVHREHFGGVDKYFIPFVSPTQDLVFTPREKRNILPEYNQGGVSVPQILTRKAEHFLWAANHFADMGYQEVNLNAGCPSGTVTAKGKGAGMLTDIPALEAFLDEVMAKSPLPVSVKTRIGFTSPMEFERIMGVYNRYPIHELIIHPRTRSQQYEGRANQYVYRDALNASPLKIVYNGDLFTTEDCQRHIDACPKTQALMLGRGLIGNPALAQTHKGGAPLSKEAFISFHDALMEAHAAFHPRNVVFGRMKEFMKYAVCSFEDFDKPRKQLRKAANMDAYLDAVHRLFDEHEISQHPGYEP